MPRLQRRRWVTWLLLMPLMFLGLQPPAHGASTAGNQGDTVQFAGTNTIDIATILQNSLSVLDSRTAGSCPAGQVVTAVNTNAAPTCSSTSGAVLSVEGQGGAVDLTTALSGTQPAFAGVGGVVTLSIPLALNTGVTAGLISKTTYDLIPSSGEKAALVGTNGTPGSGNKFVTDSDPRNTNARNPVGAASGCAEGEGFVTVGGFIACGTPGSTPGVPSTTLSALSGAAVTATGVIPPNSWVFGVQAQVTSTVVGPTTFRVGVVGHESRWGAAISGTAGTLSDIADFDVTSPVYYGATTDVVVTANGPAFSGGEVTLYLYYATLNSFGLWGGNPPSVNLPSLSGGSAVATAFIPANSWVFGIRAQVITPVTGPASFQVGIAGDEDRWGKAVPTTAGTLTNIADFAAVGPSYYRAATDVVLTPTGGAFTGGSVTLYAYYKTLDTFDTPMAGGGGGGGAVGIVEVDGVPNVLSASTIRVSNGTLTDLGGGTVDLNLVTPTPPLTSVLTQGRTDQNSVGESNFLKLGDTGLDSFIGFGVDPTDGPTIMTQCNGRPCDKRFVLGTGKEFTVGTDLEDGFRLRESHNGAMSILERGSDAAAETGRWQVYAKSTGLFVRAPGGTVTGPLGTGSGGSVAPIRPYSAIPVASSAFPIVIDGDEMLGVVDATTLAADAIWRLGFEMPPTLAGGCTYKLQLDMKANATSGVMRINPKWNTWAPGVTRASLTLNAEGVTPDSVTGAAGSGDTVTLGTGDSNQLIRIKWTLNASTVTAGQRIAMDLTFEDSSTTLAVNSGYLASVICE